jgi:N-dimethylarginine dimethylaminohydrolase
MHLTAHSESGRLRKLYIKPAAHAFVSDAHMADHWHVLNYLGKPDMTEALREYEAFESILKASGAEVLHFPENSSVNMDSIYCRDASIVTDRGIILCNMGKEGRKAEPGAKRKAYEAMGFTILGEITDPGTVEGGDVAWLDEKTLAVGHTYRTNPEGIRQLSALLAPMGVDVITVPLPHYKGPSDVFHLMSILSPVASDLAVVYSPLMPISFREWLLQRGVRLVEVPEEEFESMGCNVLALGPRDCLMVAGNPITRSRLLEAGCKVTEYKGNEISVKGGGGPTCLTRPLAREEA